MDFSSLKKLKNFLPLIAGQEAKDVLAIAERMFGRMKNMATEAEALCVEAQQLLPKVEKVVENLKDKGLF